MSTIPMPFRPSVCALGDLTFPGLRLAATRWLVIVSFVCPFFNFELLVPSSTVEVNFLLIFLAALLLPEVTLQDHRAILLALPVFAIALIGASPTACARLAIGMLPLHFLINLTRTLRARGEDILPPNLAYRSLQVFVVFCAVQTVQLNYFHILPDFVVNILVAVVPRYSTVPYDALGVHGVQGWASEPSSAALICIAFAVIAIHQRPERRWSVLAWYVVLLLLNKSIYATVLTVLLMVGCLMTLRHKLYAILALIPSSLVVLMYLTLSQRVSKLRTNLLIDGLNSDANHELARFVQILSPLQQFPHVYKPVILFGSWVMEPMGLLPLLVGYGSVLGAVWLFYILRHNFSLSPVSMRPMALIALFVLLIMSAPDLIPSILAVVIFLVPRHASSSPALADPTSRLRTCKEF